MWDDEVGQHFHRKKSFGFVKVSRSYVCVKIALLFFLLIIHRCSAPASWATQHTTVCLDCVVIIAITNNMHGNCMSAFENYACQHALWSSGCMHVTWMENVPKSTHATWNMHAHWHLQHACLGGNTTCMETTSILFQAGNWSPYIYIQFLEIL